MSEETWINRLTIVGLLFTGSGKIVTNVDTEEDTSPQIFRLVIKLELSLIHFFYITYIPSVMNI